MLMTKPNSIRFRIALGVFSLLFALVGERAKAANQFWDPSGVSVPNTSTNTWETTKWTSSATPTASTVAWVEGNPAMFAVGATTVTNGNYTVIANANHTVAGIFNGDVSDATSSNLQIKGTGSLTIASGAQGFDTQTGGNTTIRNVVTGPGAVQTQGGGSLFLWGTNTFTGGVQLNTTSGLNWNNSSALGIGLITNMKTSVIWANPPNDGGPGATDYATTPLTMVNEVWPYGAASSTIIWVGTSLQPIDWTGDWHLTSGAGTTLTLDTRSATMTISGVISGAANILKKTTTGTLVLSGANTYSGSTTIVGPVKVFSFNKVSGGTASSSLGHPTTVANGTISITTNTSLIYAGTGETTDRIIDLGSTTGGPTIQADGTGTATGPLVFTSAITVTGAGAKTLTLQGTNTAQNSIAKIIDSTGGATTVTKAQAGTWTLTGANTHTGGTTLSGGVLDIGNASALGTGTFSITGTSSYDNTTGSDLTVANNLSLGGTGTYVGSANNMTVNGTTTLTAARTVTVSAKTLTLGVVAGAGFTLTKSGNGTLALKSANTHGGTTITAGTSDCQQRSGSRNKYLYLERRVF